MKFNGKKTTTIHSSLKCPGAYWATIIFIFLIDTL